MQKVVLSVDVHDDKKCRKKVMKIACVQGVNQISLDLEKKKLTLVGSMDPVEVVLKLRKVYYTKIDTIGPAKEPEKPAKEELKPQVQATLAWEPPYYPLCPRYYCY